MKKWISQNQNGVASTFVLIAMLFFLVTIIGVYTISSNRAQTQEQMVNSTKNEYLIEGSENFKNADNTEKIPIYTKQQLFSVGKIGNTLEIEKKVYTITQTSQYELKNDIILDIAAGDLSYYDAVFGSLSNVQTGYFKILCYYDNTPSDEKNNGNYYIPINHNGNQIVPGTAVLSAYGEDYKTIGTKTTGIVGQYYLFANY